MKSLKTVLIRFSHTPHVRKITGFLLLAELVILFLFIFFAEMSSEVLFVLLGIYLIVTVLESTHSALKQYPEETIYRNKLVHILLASLTWTWRMLFLGLGIPLIVWIDAKFAGNAWLEISLLTGGLFFLLFVARKIAGHFEKKILF